MDGVTILGPDGETPLGLMDTPSAARGLTAASHYAAGSAGGEFADWNPIAASADSDLLPELGTMVGRSRDLIRNHGLASAVMQTKVDNILGDTGLRLQARPNARLLGWEEKKARAWAQDVEARFEDYAEGEDFEVDATGRTNLHGQAGLVLRSVLSNGDALALPLWLKRPGRRTATAIQLVESDRLSNPNDAMDTATLRGGIEIDRYGRPVAYHIRTTHPADLLVGGAERKWERIPATTKWGRRRVLHVCEPDRVASRKARPALSAVLGDFRTLGDYQRAELQSALTNAMVAAILEAPMDGATIADLFGDGQTYVEMREGAPELRLKRNSILRTFPGEKLSSYNPGRPNDAFAPFMDSLLHILAAGLNIPYELLLKDFSKSNYSSARAALMEAWRHFLGRRDFLRRLFYRPVYALWLEEKVNAGVIEAPGFYANRAAYTRSRWTGPGRGSVDPLKEAKATETDLATGVTTLEQECAERGLNWEEVLEQRKREQDKIEGLGLNLGQAPEVDPRLLADDDDSNETDEDRRDA